MKVHSDEWLEIWQGDCRDVLEQLPEQSVHAVITSPPYFGLRSYLDDDNPDKDKEVGREPSPSEYVAALVEVFRKVRRVLRDDGTVWLNIGDSYAAQRGGTAMPAETISGGIGGFGPDEAHRGRGNGYQPHRNASAIGLKHKDLIGIPWRVAFALQADGWVLRNDIIWSTPNPMPESVRDRFTVSHEYVFLLAKNERYYFDQDAVREPNTDVTLNRVKYGLHHRHPEGKGVGIPPVHTDKMGERFANPLGRNRRTVWTIPTKSYPGAHYAVFPEALVEPMILAATSAKGVCPTCGAPWVRVTERIREKRGDAFGRKDVGDHDHGQAGSPYEALVAVETIGWASTCDHDTQVDLRECPECHEPYRFVDDIPDWERFIDPNRPQSKRAVEVALAKNLTMAHIEALRAAGITDTGKGQVTQTGYGNNTDEVQRLATEAKDALGSYTREFTFVAPRTVGWEPTCEHVMPRTVPATILDPFAGSGTVGLVAQSHSRRAVLIDLNAEYLSQQLERNAQVPLGLGVGE